MVKQKTDREKTIQAVMRIHKEITEHGMNKDNTIFIVSHDILNLNKDRYEVIQINAVNEPEEVKPYKIIEVFDTKLAARECANTLVDMLYKEYIIK